jgi:ribonuclease HI
MTRWKNMQLDSNSIHIFTDGASLVHKGKIGGWSAVIVHQDTINEISGAKPNTTNNRMELYACIKALEVIDNKIIPIKIYSDSSYVVDGMNEWRFNWIANNWKRIKNRELWERLILLASEKLDVSFIKVKGHAGIPLNERADELATNSIEEYLTQNRSE